MTIYRAEISFDILVDAATETEAHALIRRHAEEECGNGYDLSPLSVVTNASKVPAAWLDSIPWHDGPSDDRRVLERLAEAGS